MTKILDLNGLTYYDVKIKNYIDTADDLNTNKIGDLTNLTTISKTNLVDAINEVDSNCDTNATNLLNFLNGDTELSNGLKKLIFLTDHPVGSLYFSDNNTNPSTFYGGNCGTWSNIEDKFILGASSTYPVNSTGGEDRASACFEMFTGGSGNTRLYMDYARQDFTKQYTSTNRHDISGNSTEAMELQENQAFGIKVANLNDGDKLMPPYTAKYIWVRTA